MSWNPNPNSGGAAGRNNRKRRRNYVGYGGGEGKDEEASAGTSVSVSLTCLRERDRRNTFKNLVSQLISLLPPEVLRGKRSLADQIAMAAQYVGTLESSVSALRHHSYDLRTLMNSFASSSSSSSSEVAQADSEGNRNGNGNGNGNGGGVKLSDVEVRRLGSWLEIRVCVGVEQRLQVSDMVLLLETCGLVLAKAYSCEMPPQRFLHVLVVDAASGPGAASDAPQRVKKSLFQLLSSLSPPDSDEGRLDCTLLQP